MQGELWTLGVDSQWTWGIQTWAVENGKVKGGESYWNMRQSEIWGLGRGAMIGRIQVTVLSCDSVLSEGWLMFRVLPRAPYLSSIFPHSSSSPASLLVSFPPSVYTDLTASSARTNGRADFGMCVAFNTACGFTTAWDRSTQFLSLSPWSFPNSVSEKRFAPFM